MLKPFKPVMMLLAVLLTVLSAAAQNDYRNHRHLTERLEYLAATYSGNASLKSIGKTAGQKDIWVLTLGNGDLSARPAVAIAGGIEGSHLLGTELVLGFAEKILSEAENPEIKKLLETQTFYLFPDMSPDAREQYFSKLRYERNGNDNKSYTDRSGKPVDHPYIDLNGDGMITLMRIRDHAGEWITHPDDDRVMVRAVRDEGERGEYLVFAEGKDILKDEGWKEAGVAFNRNFSFKYPVFTSGAGEHAISEPETRAIADFLFAARNVYAVISFGPANNLSEPLNYNEREASGRIITGIQERDAVINRLVSRRHNEITGNLSGTGSSASDGDFFQWAYFHYGRFSFSTPGWKVPAKDSESRGQGRTPGRDQNRELLFLEWADKKNLSDVFVPWQKVEHPGIPDRKVEVGGIVPFALNNPPFYMVDSISRQYYEFIVELTAMRPALKILNLKTEELERGLYRITADIANTGVFPTASGLGERLRWVPKTVVRLETGAGQEVLSGRSIEVLSVIDGGKAETRSWLVSGSGIVRIRAGAENTGFDEVLIKL